MCLAIFKPEKVFLMRGDLSRAFHINNDGAGFAYYDPMFKRVVINKGFWTFKDFWESFSEIQKAKMKAIVHFRLATHGDISWDNCHPYELDDGALIHNGIISAVSNYNYRDSVEDARGKDEYIPSDTMQFVERYLRGMRERELRRSHKLIEYAIGSWSKLVTLHDSGNHIIFNERAGHWNRGAWYSNSCYVARNVIQGDK